MYGTTAGNGGGVYGLNTGIGYGVGGRSQDGIGVLGQSTTGEGVIGGGGRTGVYGKTGNVDASGVHGENTGSGYGVTGVSWSGGGVMGKSYNNGDGVIGQGARNGVFGKTANAGASGVVGDNAQSGPGVTGQSKTGDGVIGAGGRNGIYGTTANASASGVYGENLAGGYGVAGQSQGIGTAVFGDNNNPAGLAGKFVGKVRIEGSLETVGGPKNFVIDHPLDPKNKYLYHAAIESPELLNVYSGNAMTDTRGEAIVWLPAYFEALNADVRYQLTVVGQMAQAVVLREIDSGQFVIKTDKPTVKVSWQVTGRRQDAYAKAHPEGGGGEVSGGTWPLAVHRTGAPCRSGSAKQ